MKVTDEMVERACRGAGWEPWQARHSMRLALEAALKDVPEPNEQPGYAAQVRRAEAAEAKRAKVRERALDLGDSTYDDILEEP